MGGGSIPFLSPLSPLSLSPPPSPLSSSPLYSFPHVKVVMDDEEYLEVHFAYPVVYVWPEEGWGYYYREGKVSPVVFQRLNKETYELFECWNDNSLISYQRDLERRLGCDLRLQSTYIGFCVNSPTKHVEVVNNRKLFDCVQDLPLCKLNRLKLRTIDGL